MRTAAAVAALALTSAGAMAEDIPAPTMKVGDRFSYRLTGGPDKPSMWTETVFEVLGGGRYRVRLDGETMKGVREFDGPGNVVQPPPWPSLKFMQFPIAIGKSWTHAVNDTVAQTRTIAYRAVAMEPLASPAGRFDCARIEGVETTGGSGVTIPVSVKLWYCPAARAIVRKESTIPVAGRVVLELTDLKLAP
jgi:hypothetical protein